MVRSPSAESIAAEKPPEEQERPVASSDPGASEKGIRGAEEPRQFRPEQVLRLPAADIASHSRAVSANGGRARDEPAAGTMQRAASGAQSLCAGSAAAQMNPVQVRRPSCGPQRRGFHHVLGCTVWRTCPRAHSEHAD